MGKHVVIGAGAVGTNLARELQQLGHDVRVITRSGSGPSANEIELVAADAADEQALASHTAGADAIYNCANPPYHRWADDWPPLATSMLHAATMAGAVLVTMSNLYGYAAPTRPMRASDPLDPPSRKGEIRVEMWTEALEAHETGRVRVTEARASDFIGPGLGQSAQMGDRVIPRILAGKSISVMGDPEADHSWTAINDVARTLAVLGTDERAWGRAWHVPTAAPMSSASLVAVLADVASVTSPTVRSIPKLALRLAGVFSPTIRELREISYQFDQPFIIDSVATTDALGIEPTPFDDTLRATIAGYR